MSDPILQPSELLRLNRLHSLSSEVNHAMIHTRSEDELLGRICESAVAHGGFTLAWIGWLNRETLDITRRASAGKPQEYLNQLKISFTDEKSLTASAVRTGRPSVWNDFLEYSNNGHWQPAALKAGLRSATAVPIRRNNGQMGALTVYANEPNFFCERGIELLSRISADISAGLEHLIAIKDAEHRMEQMKRQLLESSRMAGMAEVATSVLHNVGNVLNSVNISASLITDRIRGSKTQNLAKLATLLQEQSGDLPAFFANKGKQLPAYVSDLSRHLGNERDELLRELGALAKNIEHIKQIVAMQQSYARVTATKETIQMSELVEDAIRLNSGAIERHHVRLVCEFSEVPPVVVDKHKVVQILVNLIQNAKFALNEGEGLQDKRITLRIEKASEAENQGARVRVLVTDNGIGIKPENLSRLFEHGFTTRKTGHGFGLHSGALAAKELGGSLTAHSDGPGRGATFVLEVPCDSNPKSL